MKYIKIGMAVLIVGILANLLFGGGADKDADIPQLMNSGALIVDTRTPGEFAGGSIEGAINIPYDIIAGTIDQYTTDKSSSIVVFCQSGARSGTAKKYLLKAGYTNVVNGGSLGRMRRTVTE